MVTIDTHMDKSSKILITGASGLIGSALVRLLKGEGYENVLVPTSEELDLRYQNETYSYFFKHLPEYVFHLAAYVGGIQSNYSEPANFIQFNTLMQCNVIEACYGHRIKKLLFPGSACAYPAIPDRKILESDFLQGAPEPTNLAYAIAKQNGIVMAQSYAKQYGMKVVLPMVANTYGQGDRSSHVIPMMIEKFRNAEREETINLWGTGRPLREFIHADDVASAFLFLMLNYDSSEIINVGTGDEINMAELAVNICYLIGRPMNPLSFDSTKSDGIARKCLDSLKLRKLGWRPKISLYEGLRSVISAH